MKRVIGSALEELVPLRLRTGVRPAGKGISRWMSPEAVGAKRYRGRLERWLKNTKKQTDARLGRRAKRQQTHRQHQRVAKQMSVSAIYKRRWQTSSFLVEGPKSAALIATHRCRTLRELGPRGVCACTSMGVCKCACNCVEEKLSIVALLKPNASPGYDSISLKVARKCISHIGNSLCDIFNKFLLSGVSPDGLKLAKVIPIYKADDRLSVSNYRPISVLLFLKYWIK